LIGLETSIQGINDFVVHHEAVTVTVIASEWPEQTLSNFAEEIEMNTELDPAGLEVEGRE
jgi:hypothetical protein